MKGVQSNDRKFPTNIAVITCSLPNATIDDQLNNTELPRMNISHSNYSGRRLWRSFFTFSRIVFIIEEVQVHYLCSEDTTQVKGNCWTRDLNVFPAVAIRSSEKRLPENMAMKNSDCTLTYTYKASFSFNAGNVNDKTRTFHCEAQGGLEQFYPDCKRNCLSICQGCACHKTRPCDSQNFMVWVLEKRVLLSSARKVVEASVTPPRKEQCHRHDKRSGEKVTVRSMQQEIKEQSSHRWTSIFVYLLFLAYWLFSYWQRHLQH